MHQSGGGDDQIKRSRPDAPALSAEVFAQLSAAPGNSQGKWKERDGGQECLELRLGLLRVHVSERPLIELELGDDADPDALGNEGVEQVCGNRIVGQVVEDPVGVDQVGHLLVGVAGSVLLPGLLEVSDKLVMVDSRERPLSLP